MKLTFSKAEIAVCCSASLIVLPYIGFSLAAIGVDAKQNEGLSKTRCLERTDSHLALRAYGKE